MERRIKFDLNEAGKLTKQEINAPNADNTEVKSNVLLDVTDKVKDPNSKFIDKFEIQHVHLVQYPERLTTLFHIVAKFFGSICEMMDPTNPEDLRVYFDAEFKSAEFLVSCAERKISLYVNGKVVTLFESLTYPDIPLIYDWRNNEYLEGVPGDVWTSITHYEKYTELPKELYFRYSAKHVEFSLDVLKADLGELSTMSASSKFSPTPNEITGVIFLGKKMIAVLKQVSGQKGGVMKVEGELDLENDQEIYFNANNFCDRHGTPWGETMVSMGKLFSLPVIVFNNFPSIVDYIDVKTFKTLISKQKNEFLHLRKEQVLPNVLVIGYSVYMGRSFIRIEYRDEESVVCFIDHLVLLTAHKDDNGKWTAAKYEYESVYYVPEKETFLTLQGPIEHNIFAIRLPHYVDESSLQTSGLNTVHYRQLWNDWDLVFEVPVLSSNPGK